MPYLIDGHNLIPYLSGLSLEQIDDEMELIGQLTPFFQRMQKKAVVYFDRAFPGASGRYSRGKLDARFIRPPRIADDAILSDLEKMGREAKNCIVVTSDLNLREAAMRLGASVITSADFARKLSSKSSEKSQSAVEPDDMDYWLRVFRQNSNNS